MPKWVEQVATRISIYPSEWLWKKLSPLLETDELQEPWRLWIESNLPWADGRAMSRPKACLLMLEEVSTKLYPAGSPRRVRALLKLLRKALEKQEKQLLAA